MAANRKLQQLVDSTLKKVEEGLYEFSGQWAKVEECTNPNQREKYMADLKRDIKKLQRFREDIMKWMSNPEVKDKTSLQESRRRIEVEMERFKAFERESKTKPFSLMGLAMGDRLDANEQKKQEKREPLEETVERLTVQSDEFRAEWESLMAKKKKSKDEVSRVDDLKKFIDWHAFHLRNLEQVLRRLDNDIIDPDELDILVDSLSVYLEQFEDPDYYHDEGVYEQFNLDSDAVDDTYYKPSLDESAEEGKPVQSSSSVPAEAPKLREVPLTAAAKAKAKKQAAREIEAAQTGGPVRPDHPAQNPPKPARPATPAISPPPLPTPPNPPGRPAPLLAGLPSSMAPVAQKTLGVWSSSDVSASTRPPPPPPPSSSIATGDRLRDLEVSFGTRPSCLDFVRIRGYAPSNQYVHTGHHGRALYPESEAWSHGTNTMEQLSLDTLALVFYYREGTFSQFAAAEELRRRNWRFHKKFGLWFRRSESGSVKTLNPAFEYGSYSFFDVTGDNWATKVRSDFTFEYEYLEEDGLSFTGSPRNSELVICRPPPPAVSGIAL